MVIRSMELMGSSPAATATAPVTAMPQLEYFDTGYSGGEMSFELVTVWQLSRCGERQQADRAKLKKKFIKALRGSEPIVPKHQPPKSIGESVPSLVRREDRLFFDDFRDFGTVVNWCLADEHVGGPWRLQELPNTDLSLNFSHMPDFGRRYDIFYNQVPLGTLEVSPGGGYSSQEPLVYTDINLDWVRLLAIETVRDFFHDIALHVCDANPRTHGYLQTRVLIDGALTKTLWRTQQITQLNFDSQDYGELTLRLAGSAAFYLQRRQALRSRQAAA